MWGVQNRGGDKQFELEIQILAWYDILNLG